MALIILAVTPLNFTSFSVMSVLKCEPMITTVAGVLFADVGVKEVITGGGNKSSLLSVFMKKPKEIAETKMIAILARKFSFILNKRDFIPSRIFNVKLKTEEFLME